jgi:16S rRNA (guanine(527)-N(7))-methyltransferase RsmG
MVLDPREDVLPARPATNRLVTIRLSVCAAAVELEQVRRARRVVDIGSGLGFPGLVLASMLPQASVTLVEKREERCSFLRRSAAAMGLTNVEVVHGEAQSWKDGAMSVDLVTARALARPRIMVRLAAPLLLLGGTAVVWGNPKREPAKEADADSAAEAAGLRPVTVHETKPVGLGARYLYVYKKVAATPPRRALKAARGSGRKPDQHARAIAVAEVQRKAVERLERAARRVQELEASEARDPAVAAELRPRPRGRSQGRAADRRVIASAGSGRAQARGKVSLRGRR